MTAYRFRLLTAGALFGLLVFAVLAFGAVDAWALTVWKLGVFALAAAWVARLAITARPPVWNRFYVPLGLAVIWIWIQSATGLSVNRHQSGAEALKWLSFLLAYAVACQCFTDQTIRRRFRLALVWFSFALCVFGLAQYFTSPGAMYWSIPLAAGRPFGPFVNRNHFAAWMELVVPAALWLTLRASEQRIIYVVVYGLILSTVVVAGSRVGVALVAVETGVILLVRVLASRHRRRPQPRRYAWLPLAGVAAAAVLSFTVASSEELLSRFQEEQPYSIRWRVVVASWQLFVSRLWTGYGAGTWADVYPSAAPFDLGFSWPHAHNDIVQIAMEWGAPGVLILVILLALLFSRRRSQEDWLRAVLPVLAVLAHSWFDFPLQIPALTAGWLLTLAQVEPEPPNVGRASASAGF